MSNQNERMFKALTEPSELSQKIEQALFTSRPPVGAPMPGLLARIDAHLENQDILRKAMDRLELQRNDSPYEVIDQIRKVNAANYENKVTSLGPGEWDSYRKKVVANMPVRPVLLSESDLISLHKSMGDFLFYQLIRRTEIWTSPEGADYIEQFWSGYGN